MSGSTSTAASSTSATTAKASPSTTKARATRSFVEPFALADRLVTAGEYLAFIEDGGYVRPEFWLSDGWDVVRAQGWQAPLYWSKRDKGWRIFTLQGERALDPNEPVVHVSYYEADAYRALGRCAPANRSGMGARGNLLAGRSEHARSAASAPAPAARTQA